MTDHRQEQCQKMLKYLTERGGAGVTRKQFADLLGIKKSQHLAGLINELVSRKLAVKKSKKNGGRLPTFVYYPVEEVIAG